MQPVPVPEPFPSRISEKALGTLCVQHKNYSIAMQRNKLYSAVLRVEMDSHYALGRKYYNIYRLLVMDSKTNSMDSEI